MGPPFSFARSLRRIAAPVPTPGWTVRIQSNPAGRKVAAALTVLALALASASGAAETGVIPDPEAAAAPRSAAFADATAGLGLQDRLILAERLEGPLPTPAEIGPPTDGPAWRGLQAAPEPWLLRALSVLLLIGVAVVIWRLAPLGRGLFGADHAPTAAGPTARPPENAAPPPPPDTLDALLARALVEAQRRAGQAPAPSDTPRRVLARLPRDLPERPLLAALVAEHERAVFAGAGIDAAAVAAWRRRLTAPGDRRL